MNIFIVSESFIIREGLEHLLICLEEFSNVQVFKSINDIKNDILKDIDGLVIDMKDNSNEKIEF